MINTVNTISNGIGRLLIGSLSRFFPWGPLILISLLIALLALAIFRLVSDQDAIKRAKGIMLARVLEIRLFKDDLPGIFSALGRILVAIGGYLRRTLKPIAILIIPVLFLLFQMASWYEQRPLTPSESSLLSVALSDDVDPSSVRLEGSPSLQIETEGFRAPEGDEVVWRLHAVDNHPAGVLVSVGDLTLKHEVVIAERLVPVSAMRGQGWWTRLENPAAVPLPDEMPLRVIHISYPKRELTVAGLHVHWAVALLVLSLVFGVLLKRPLGIEF